jgi:hypothetical protein
MYSGSKHGLINYEQFFIYTIKHELHVTFSHHAIIYLPANPSFI